MLRHGLAADAGKTVEWTDPAGTPYALRFQEGHLYAVVVDAAGQAAVYDLPETYSSDPKLCVVNRWTAGKGNFTEQVRLIAPDGTTVIRKSSAKLALPDPVQNVTNVSLFAQVEFATAGVYFIEVLVDDVMKLRYAVPLVVVPQPGGEGAGEQS